MRVAEPTTATKGAPAPAWVRSIGVLGFIIAFLVGVAALEKGIKLLGADAQERLFDTVSNPLAGLFVGILATVLVQSSSASTSVIVGLVASGAVSLDAAVPMIMGANIGTTVTNTLVSMGHVRQTREFERALAAATVHDFFNLLCVAVLLPLELITGVFSRVATRLAEALMGTGGATWESPIKKFVNWPADRLRDLAQSPGWPDGVAGVVLIAMGLVVILVSLTLITRTMKSLIAERVERALNSVLGRGGGLVAMVLGMLVTVAVQSSSITTAILVPLAASGVLTLRTTYPVTLGANVGTTITALLAALAASRSEALAIALVHTMFNVVGIVLVYPVRAVRDIPLRAAEALARLAAHRRRWAVGYVVVVFLVVPFVGVIVLN